jgi:uncharacterized protein Yka (UPF0111/DUF47 family)
MARLREIHMKAELVHHLTNELLSQVSEPHEVPRYFSKVERIESEADHLADLAEALMDHIWQGEGKRCKS